MKGMLALLVSTVVVPASSALADWPTVAGYVPWNGSSVYAVEDQYVAVTTNAQDLALVAQKWDLPITDYISIGPSEEGEYAFYTQAPVSLVESWQTIPDFQSLHPEFLVQIPLGAISYLDATPVNFTASSVPEPSACLITFVALSSMIQRRPRRRV